MKLVNIGLILITTFCCSYTAAERISEIKCREYSSIPTNVLKPQPHLVWLRIATENQIIVGVIGTLVSENFVLTTAVTNLIIHQSQVYFTPDERYNIVERHTHPFYGQTAHHDLAILRLELALVLDSFHRPACLWAREYFNLTTAELVAWNSTKWTDDYDVKTLKIITGPECAGLHSQQNESLVCMKPRGAEDYDFVPAPGSPIQIRNLGADLLLTNHYIYGIFSFYYYNSKPYTNVGTKIFVHLAWIESHIWPNDACGNVDETYHSTSNQSTTFPGEFPWHTAIYQLVNIGERNYRCDGILLNEKTVLTVATCVSNPLVLTSPRVLVAILGLYDLELMSDARQEIRIKRVIMKYNFDNVLHANDLALLKLQSAVRFSNLIKPICLATNELVFESNRVVGLMPGWGQIDFDMSASVLSKGAMSVQNVSEDSFTAVYQNAVDACAGSLGGGLVIEVHKRWYLKGIMITAAPLPSQTRCDATALVTFTDAVKWYGWIKKHL